MPKRAQWQIERVFRKTKVSLKKEKKDSGESLIILKKNSHIYIDMLPVSNNNNNKNNNNSNSKVQIKIV